MLLQFFDVLGLGLSRKLFSSGSVPIHGHDYYLEDLRHREQRLAQELKGLEWLISINFEAETRHKVLNAPCRSN